MPLKLIYKINNKDEKGVTHNLRYELPEYYFLNEFKDTNTINKSEEE